MRGEPVISAKRRQPPDSANGAEYSPVPSEDSLLTFL